MNGRRLVWMLCAWVAAAGELAGPDTCRACHPRQFTTQSKSQHAMALRPILQTPLPGLLAAQPLRERSGISFEYSPAKEALNVRASQGERSVSALLEWTFGSGAQAYTPVGMLDGRFFEHRISYYRAAAGARRTLGHPGTPSADPRSALGVLQDAETIYRCFNCHATGVKAGPDLRAMIPGVTCERCHGSAAAHVARGAPMEKAKFDREQVMALCGSCHRLPPQGSSRTPEAQDPLSIRFAPVGLAASKCYRESETLSCLTCHDPHQDASQDRSYYTGRCLSCHAQQNQCRAGARTDCVSCHMGQSSPAPYLTFTDHRIRVLARP